MLVLAPDEGVEPRGGHERGADRLDLVNVPKLGLVQQLVKVADLYRGGGNLLEL